MPIMFNWVDCLSVMVIQKKPSLVEVQCVGFAMGGMFTHIGTLLGLTLSSIATWWMWSFGGVNVYPYTYYILIAHDWLRFRGVVIGGFKVAMKRIVVSTCGS